MMKKLLVFIGLLAALQVLQAKDYTRYVSPLVGTLSSFELSTGNTYPAIARPWGMNFWTPQLERWAMDGSMYIQLIRFADSNRLTNPVRGLMTTDSSLSCR